MTNTHISHFGLEFTAQTLTSVVLSGTLANCKRIAAAHGMEIDRTEGRIVSCDGDNAIYSPTSGDKPNRIVYKNGGMIQRCANDYAIVIPVDVWNAQ